MKKLHLIIIALACTAFSVVAGDTQQRISSHKFTVLGGVKRPGIYTVHSLAPRLIDAIASAGGLSPHASAKDVVVKREHNGKIEILKVDLSSILSGPAPFHSVRSGDLIFVKERVF